jgi:tetratricopeptide (TPR) repeat protein
MPAAIVEALPPARPLPLDVDLRFLQDRDLYHKLTTDDIHNAFLNSELRPRNDATLAMLLEGGHFRRAAEVAMRTIVQCPPDVASQILPLFYTRLACLVLISRQDFALQEALPLLEILSINSHEAQAVVAQIPWELRLLLARLQMAGAADGGRRGIMTLYMLTTEARAALRAGRDAGDPRATELWSARLQDLGFRVGDALVEMGEVETADRHFNSLVGVCATEDLEYRRALLRVRLGDRDGAQRSVAKLSEGSRKRTLHALLDIAEGDYTSAIETWQSLIEEYPNHELFAQNAAVSLLYTGHIRSTRDALEDISQRLPMFPALLFNLSTVYELCTERAAEKKNNLVQASADRTPQPASGGWERANIEFKL